MAGVSWTDSQLNAIECKDGAVLVSAAAGSGKTAVLVERVIRMITDSESPVDVDRLLVVTYTRAAAGEMKERIDARLSQLLEDDPYNENLHRQQLLLGRAHISTIHSFCSEIVREYFYVLNIASDFRIADDGELSIIKDQAMQNVLERQYSKNDDVFENTVEVFSSVRDDTILQRIILRLYEFLRSHPFPSDWIREKTSMYDKTKTAGETQWGKTIINHSLVMAGFIKTLNDTSLKLLENEPKLNESSFGDLIRDDGIFISHLINRLQSGVWDDIIEVIKIYKAGTLRAPKGFTDNEIKIAVADYRKILKESLEEIKKLFIRNNEQCMDDIADLYPVVSKLFDLTELFGEEYSLLKEEKGIADFSDLEHWALRLLAKNTDDGIRFTDIARVISSRFDYVMVDEYQDANTIQDTIFKAVSDDDKKLFVVGDVKQSIYRFRQAMPEIFIARKNRYNLYDRSDVRYPAKIILDTNFRSREGVTSGVNFVFKNLMSESVGDIDYNDEEALKAGAEYAEDTGNAVSFHLLDLENSDTGDRDTEEAHYIGKLIYKMMSQERIKSKDGLRKPTYGDFCILMRGVSNHAVIFEQELLKMAIPCVSETSESFFSQQEIRVMLSFLRIIDNPVQDIPLASVMMSPIFGFTTDEIAAMRAAHPIGSLYYIVLCECQNGNKKTISFLNMINRLREKAANVTSDKLINIIYNETSYPEIVSAGEDGLFKRSNLRLLIHYAKTYENSGYKGISGFVRFIERLRESSCDLAAAPHKSSISENAVRIMTIHKSKGLEFPICIVANLNRRFNTDTRNEVLLHNELGLGVRRKDDTRMCRYTTMPREAVALELKRSEISEELRVLYVALTRAKERLVLVGSVNSPERYVRGVVKSFAFDKVISPYTAASASCMCDWITDCLLVHKSGGKLRELGGYIGEISDVSDYSWDINIIRDLDTSQQDNKDTAILEAMKAADDFERKQEYLDKLKKKLSREYEYTKLTEIPVKVTASSLAEKKSSISYEIEAAPLFMSQQKITGAMRGTAMHIFAQYCKYDEALSDIESEIQRLTDNGFLTLEQANLLNRESIYAFLTSPLVSRMKRSAYLKREFRFTVEVPAGIADETLEPPYSEEHIILQGAIDCMFEENGKMVIVDYKTDKGKTKQQLSEMYSVQLRLYKNAVEQITGKSVSQCIIYSFALGEEIITVL